MRHFATSLVGLVLLVLFMRPSGALAQGDAAEQDGLGEVRKTFKQAGYDFHGQVDSFVARSRPARTEFDLVIVGFLPEHGTSRYKGPYALWRVEAGEIDTLSPPNPEAGWERWTGNVIPHASGAVFGTLYNARGRNNTRYLPCMLTDTDELVEIKLPPNLFALTSDVNPSGTAVGYTSGNHRLGAYTWTRDGGYKALPAGNAKNAQPLAINRQGMVVGLAMQDGMRPCVWPAPKQPGGEQAVTVLDPPKDFKEARAIDVNDKGVVLISCRTKEQAENNRTRYISTPYTWQAGKGYTALPKPEHDSASPLAIDKHGHVLLMSWDFPEPNAQRRTYQYISYLCRDGKAHKLPDYPGAQQTDYRYMSDEGLIVGSAWFDKDKPGPGGAKVLTFLISVKK